jgi:predicted transcriptional regulator
MSTTAKPKMGRPPGQEFPHLLHVRISDDMKVELDRIQDARLDRPNTTALVREALALLIRREKQRERT